MRVRAVSCESRGRWSLGRLIAVAGHKRTLPRLRDALNPLPAVIGIDSACAESTAGARLLASRAYRCTGVSKGAGAPTPPRIPQTPAHGIICSPSPCWARSRAQRGGTICNWGILVHSHSEIDLLVVRDLDLSRCVRSCPAPVPFNALEHHWIGTLQLRQQPLGLLA